MEPNDHGDRELGNARSLFEDIVKPGLLVGRSLNPGCGDVVAEGTDIEFKYEAINDIELGSGNETKPFNNDVWVLLNWDRARCGVEVEEEPVAAGRPKVDSGGSVLQEISCIFRISSS